MLLVGLVETKISGNRTATVSRWTVNDTFLLKSGIARDNAQRPNSGGLSARGTEGGIQISCLMESRREVTGYNVGTPALNPRFFGLNRVVGLWMARFGRSCSKKTAHLTEGYPATPIDH